MAYAWARWVSQMAHAWACRLCQMAYAWAPGVDLMAYAWAGRNCQKAYAWAEPMLSAHARSIDEPGPLPHLTRLTSTCAALATAVSPSATCLVPHGEGSQCLCRTHPFCWLPRPCLHRNPLSVCRRCTTLVSMHGHLPMLAGHPTPQASPQHTPTLSLTLPFAAHACAALAVEPGRLPPLLTTVPRCPPFLSLRAG